MLNHFQQKSQFLSVKDYLMRLDTVSFWLSMHKWCGWQAADGHASPFHAESGADIHLRKRVSERIWHLPGVPKVDVFFQPICFIDCQKF